jgi:hypothetical protein
MGAIPPMLAGRVPEKPFTSIAAGILGDDEKNDYR